MKTILYIIIIALSLFAPARRLDVAKLEPVEAIALSTEDGLLILKTDGESIGKGKTVEEALADLRTNTPAVIYLDTARYLLAGEGTEAYLAPMKGYLKKDVKVGVYRGGDVKEEAKYLDAHDESAKPEVDF